MRAVPPLEVQNTAGVTWDFYGPTLDLPLDESTRQKHDAWQMKLAELESQREEAASRGNDDFQRWIASIRDGAPAGAAWQPVKPEAFETTGGETFEILQDGAVLLGGSVPDSVEHVFTIVPPEAPITAIKLDALTDASTPA
jgi:hypothetical protein